jgi:hypothetical protein
VLRIAARQAALIKKLRPSTPNAHPVPTVAEIIPPASGPNKNRANDSLSDDNELAETRNSAGRISGMIAVAAGLKKAAAIPKITASINNCQRRACPVRARKDTRDTEIPQTVSEMSIVMRLENRSTNVPPKRRKVPVEIALTLTTSARSSGFPVR